MVDSIVVSTLEKQHAEDKWVMGRKGQGVGYCTCFTPLSEAHGMAFSPTTAYSLLLLKSVLPQLTHFTEGKDLCLPVMVALGTLPDPCHWSIEPRTEMGSLCGVQSFIWGNTDLTA